MNCLDPATVNKIGNTSNNYKLVYVNFTSWLLMYFSYEFLLSVKKSYLHFKKIFFLCRSMFENAMK